MKYNLLSVGADAKTKKGVNSGYLTGILYLAPAMESGFEVCPSRSAGCTAACLFTAGHGAYPKVKEARIRKTQFLMKSRADFLSVLKSDIAILVAEANNKGLKPCVRLNGTSDLGWESMAKEIMEAFPDVQFYDYTKVLTRMLRYCDGKFPANYHLTFSRSESNWDDCIKVLAKGGNVAAVFSKDLPGVHIGYTVVDGDVNDLRFNDPRNVIVGLKAKGKARKDDSGFVIVA
jgi:hypothetical protein